MKTIGLVANMYCEANALPGWIETHLPFFDDIRVLHAGPGGAYSDDGTIEILEKWKIPIEFCAIDDGFGVVRTKALRMSKCDFIMLLDADERFFACHQVLTCAGESTPPDEVNTILQSYDFRDLNAMACNWENIGRLGAKLNVTAGASYNQGVFLRELLVAVVLPVFRGCDHVAGVDYPAAVVIKLELHRLQPDIHALGRLVQVCHTG